MSAARISLYSYYTLHAFTSALEKCDKICVIHSYHEAVGKMCDLCEVCREIITLKCYGESRTLSKKGQ